MPGSRPTRAVDVSWTYAFALADPRFRFSAPAPRALTIEAQRSILEMYEGFPAKSLLD